MAAGAREVAAMAVVDWEAVRVVVVKVVVEKAAVARVAARVVERAVAKVEEARVVGQ